MHFRKMHFRKMHFWKMYFQTGARIALSDREVDRSSEPGIGPSVSVFLTQLMHDLSVARQLKTLCWKQLNNTIWNQLKMLHILRNHLKTLSAQRRLTCKKRQRTSPRCSLLTCSSPDFGMRKIEDTIVKLPVDTYSSFPLPGLPCKEATKRTCCRSSPILSDRGTMNFFFWRIGSPARGFRSHKMGTSAPRPPAESSRNGAGSDTWMNS